MSTNLSMAAVCFAVAIALSLDLAHPYFRSGLMPSVSEAVSKLTAVSAITLMAGLALAGRGSGLGVIFGLLVLMCFSIGVLAAQVAVYKRQLTVTKDYLAELLAERRCPESLVRHVEALVDADFEPSSWGNRTLNGGLRGKQRRAVAALLTSLGIKITEDELVVPLDQRVGVRAYRALAVTAVVALVTYLAITLVSGFPE